MSSTVYAPDAGAAETGIMERFHSTPEPDIQPPPEHEPGPQDAPEPDPVPVREPPTPPTPIKAMPGAAVVVSPQRATAGAIVMRASSKPFYNNAPTFFCFRRA
jgi:hypothetical protein